MTVAVDPVAWSLGGFAIRWYGLIAVAAAGVAFIVARRGTRRAGIPDAIVSDGAIWVAVAAVIGGVTFEGGRGTVLGAFLGCLLIGIISNALDILGVDAYVKIVITGAIIVSAVVLSNLDKLRRRA